MKLKYFLCLIVSISLIVTATGCNDGHSTKPLTITNESIVVLIPDGPDGKGRNLVFSVFIKNNTRKKSEPFYVEFFVKDKWLSSQMETNKFILDQGMDGDSLQEKLFTINANSAFGRGGIYHISSPVNEKKLKKAIEENHAVKVRLFNKDNKEITSGYITNYGKDLTADGVNDAIIDAFSGQ